MHRLFSIKVYISFGVLALILILASSHFSISRNLDADWAPENLGDDAFTFTVLGDTSYKQPRDFPAYLSLIHSINKSKPAFSIHVGDTKPGHGTCNEAWQLKVRSFFDKFEAPLIYTPGDNDWTDCGRSLTREDPIASLGFIRKVFFSNSDSQGKNPLKLTRQSDLQPKHKIPENAAWQYRGVQFGTLHLVATNNNLRPKNEVAMAEYHTRNSANLAWIDYLFEQAHSSDIKALVIAFHSKLGYGKVKFSGYVDTINTTQKEAARLNKPVLLVHGDVHRYRVDLLFEETPFQNYPAGTFAHVKRLQTYGFPFQKATQVIVRPLEKNRDRVFEIRPYEPPWGGCTFVPVCALLGVG
jgi:hypothetical protein